MTQCLVNHHITGHLLFFLLSTEWVKTCPVTDNPTTCEICDVICFPYTKNMSAAEIHCELCAVVYGQIIMCDGTVRQWCRMFKDQQANKCSRWRAKWLAICTEWWSYSNCWPNNLWKMAPHNFRTLVWISTKFTHCSLRDYHS
jgi:hypothetical protein